MKDEIFKWIIPFIFALLCFACLFANVGCFNDSGIISKWIGAYFLSFLLGICALAGKEKAPKFLPIEILLFACWALFVCFAILNKNANIDLYLKAGSLLALYLAFRQIVCENSIVALFAIIVVVVFCLSLYGIVQALGFASTESLFKVSGNFDNPAGYASALALGFPFCLHIVFLSKKIIYKTNVLLILTTVLAAIILSESRAGLLSVIIASGFYLYFKFAKRISKKGKCTFAVLALIVVLALSSLYWIKKDSADGRLLIWKCSWEMIKEKPFFGFGINGFDANYMLYQASYFEQNLDSSFSMLADNVKHPFNEFLFLLIQLGIVVGLFVLLLIVAIAMYFRKNQNPQTIGFYSALVSLCVFSCFSYPMKYPFSWVILLLCLAGIFNLSSENISSFKSLLLKKTSPFLYLLFVAGMSITCFYIYIENKWYRITHESLAGNTRLMIPKYRKLFPYMQNDPLFLYNFAAELNYINDYQRSEEILDSCKELMNDYDIQMLAANNFMGLKEYNKAKACLYTAANMCPVRFMPLYYLAEVYKETGEKDRLLEVAGIVINKPVKVNSSSVRFVKAEMEKVIRDN